MLDHFFGGIEVGNHPVAHRADRLDRTWRPSEHQLCVLTHGKNLLFPVLDVVGHHRRLIQHDALATNVNKRVRSAKVNRHVRREEARK